jgi:hypothetical protein
MVHTGLILLAIVPWLVIGIAGLFYPRWIQAMAIWSASHRWKPLRSAWVLQFVSSKGYVVYVRVMGLLALLAGVFMLWVVIVSS